VTKTLHKQSKSILVRYIIFKLLGKNGWTFGMVVYILNYFVPLIFWFNILSQTLFPVIIVFISMINPDYSNTTDTSITIDSFSYTWTCIIFFVLMNLMTSSKNLSIFVKINTIGILFVIAILGFVIGTGFYSL
jgi:hypothetical protein